MRRQTTCRLEIQNVLPVDSVSPTKQKTFKLLSLVRKTKEVKMTFEEMYALACQRKKEMPEGKGTTELFKKGPHGIGKKLVEEAAESWMAARFESRDAQCLELSQVLYYVAVMMAEKGLTLEEVYAKL